KIKQLKGLKIGVVAGREGQKIIEEAIKNGVLKNSGAEVVVFDTDAEAGHAILNENIHALIVDELPAKVITGEVAIRGSMNFG
ncbi:MAG: transporter substrate-binding domain-containing protein, partial [Clostridia bacterium]|nr:transporter substrate-binding domain-containing protein [Clostridia bacterium]